MNDTVQENHDKLVEVTKALTALIATIEAHEVTCFSCDRDGEKYCDCLKRQVAQIKHDLAARRAPQED